MEKTTLKTLVLEQRENIIAKDKGLKRDSLSEVAPNLKLPHCLIIAGIRRVGKSTLLLQIIDSYFGEDFYYFNFEDERLVNFNIEDFNLLYEVMIEFYGEKKTFFFDEIQNIKGWETFVRRMMDKNYKFVLTGSNATLLSRELGTKLTGRYILSTLYPFSFKEFLKFKEYSLDKKDLLITEKKVKIKKQFDEYLKRGGMPEYLKYNFNTEILQRLYEDIIYRDIAARYGIKDMKTLRELALYYLTNITGEISYNKLKNTYKTGSVNTIKNYTEYLENSFLVDILNIFSYSIKQQAIAPKKVFCIDNGIADCISFAFSDNMGRYLENLVYIELKRRGETLYYYRTKNNNTVDFAVKRGNKISEIIQVCFDIGNEKTREREIKSLDQAMEELELNEGLIITYENEEIIKMNGKSIKIMPAYKWLIV
ncbi:MAG: ATP-binding protein [Actinomycetota bacterium]|nr:ATP-binding protein [Actinomycetota bacterium]